MRRAELEAFAAALRDPQARIPAELRAPEGAPVADRFEVYRNNVHAGLVDALAERFPVVRALVGDEFFRAMARAYVRLERPRDANLCRYGGNFAAFIAGFEPARELPYLPDVAGLESAWHECWGAAEAEPLGLSEIAAVPPEELILSGFRTHPAARLLRSAWPVGSLWLAHQTDEPDLAGLVWQPENVLVTRPQAAIDVRCVEPGTAAFIAALLAGDPLERAFDAALVESPAFEPAPALQQLAAAGLWAGIRRAPV